MTEAEARQAIIPWARNHFVENEEQVIPDVEVVSITYDEHNDEWEAELSVSTSADNPYVTFFMDERPDYGLQIVSVEY